MTNHPDLHHQDSIHGEPAMTPTNAPPDSKAAPPQSLPVAPTFPAGFTSRYDSDMDDDVSVSLSDNDDRDDTFEDSCTMTTTHNSMTESFTTVDGESPPDLMTQAALVAATAAAATTTRPRYVPPLPDEPKAISIRASSTLYLPTLPMDTLHRLSLFLTARELCCLAMTTKRMGERCDEVWRRVRMHAGRCLGEVMLAWATGEHADARELAALYLQNGVPIYPSPHGHAYHTVAWRMGLEVKQMQNGDNDESNDVAASTGPPENLSALDPFYSAHFLRDDEENDHSRPPLTYVEEKSLFWKQKNGIPIEEPGANIISPFSPPIRASSARGRRRTLDTVSLGAAALFRHALRNNPQAAERPHRPIRRSSFSSTSPPTKKVPTNNEIEHPKMTLRIHRHLADQHLFNLPSIQDVMDVGPINLNADFFHPHIENSLRQRQTKMMWGTSLSRRDAGVITMDETVRIQRGEENGLNELLDGVLPWETGLDGGAFNHAVVDWDLAGDLRSYRSRSASRISESMLETPRSVPHTSPASDVALQMYSLSSPNLKNDTDDNSDETLSEVHVRFAHHHRKLETCLASSSVQEFDDCLLDWWDELFPITAGIHFYNRQSPVPRMTHLQSFLTSPCPKAIGIVQCEIERVKISSKKKLFPSYEYRLFIRDVMNDNPHNIPRVPPRKDSVLLVAKNKLPRRKGRGSSVHASTGPTTKESSSSTKRGVTNYYMCLPTQRDVDSHYRSANKTLELGPGEKSGLDVAPSTSGGPVALGRVQGNFIGTEFQIYSPVESKASKAEVFDPSSSSEDGMDAGDHPSTPGSRRRASVDTTHPRQRGANGLVRLARRASLTMTRRPSLSGFSGFRRHSMDPADTDDEQNNKVCRRMKSTRTKRSAIANSESDGQCPRECTAIEEEECGAITYTANLLGNRPRIMDVCIPKIMEDGSQCRAWRRPTDMDVEDGDVGSNNRMLNQFKAIQQAREQAEAEALEDREDVTPRIVDDHGLLVLQNRPPWWNFEIGAFVLNFGGRVSVASVKNFQLCERTNQDHIMLQFGRISGRHSFTMDFQHPLTPMQAFAIAISSLQSKISFG